MLFLPVYLMDGRESDEKWYKFYEAPVTIIGHIPRILAPYPQTIKDFY
jgi:hypothetical protein